MFVLKKGVNFIRRCEKCFNFVQAWLLCTAMFEPIAARRQAIERRPHHHNNCARTAQLAMPDRVLRQTTMKSALMLPQQMGGTCTSNPHAENTRCTFASCQESNPNPTNMNGTANTSAMQKTPSATCPQTSDTALQAQSVLSVDPTAPLRLVDREPAGLALAPGLAALLALLMSVLPMTP